ncbi:hypothetical protein NE237_024299 [Protea cynaroides]|uniref:LysM domain-containing protein n=1 Tax=Protea cynaroides TaxID=273540 RepID=A0A9Q0HGN9_9MAGN|nr:hypothetical protein NE237_024299 [Protea cynaroides]
MALGFTCNSTTTKTCESLIDYVSPSDTTLANISSLFGVTNFYSLLGANFSLSTPSNQSFAANDTIKIPFPYSCSNGIGISDKIPLYTVKSGDNWDYIATYVYSRISVVHYGHVVTKGSSVEQIAVEYGTDANTILELNGISNANQLQAKKVLDVPLTVCNLVVHKESEDFPLLVANGTYALTASNCIQCKCQPSISAYNPLST